MEVEVKDDTKVRSILMVGQNAARVLRHYLNHLVPLWAFTEIGYSLLRNSRMPVIMDHSYFATRFLLDKVFFVKNGFFHLPYYTPAYGGGLPHYGNPTNMYFSLVQWMVDLFPSFSVGYKLSFVLCLFIAYAGFYRFLRSFKIDRWIAALAAFAFSINGYHVVLWYGGNVVHQSYCLLPWMLLNIRRYWSGRDRLISLLWISSILGYMVYSAGYYMGVFAGILSATFLVALALSRPTSTRLSVKGILLPSAFVLVVAGLISASKLSAAYDCMSVFSRVVPNDTVSFSGALRLMFRGFFNPHLGFRTPLPTPGGWWELTASYMGVTSFIILSAGTLYCLAREKVWARSAADSNVRFFYVWAAVLLPVVVFFVVGDNFGWYFLKKGTFLRSLHANFQYMGCVPFVAFGLVAALLSELSVSYGRRILSMAAAFILVVDILCYHAYHRHFDWPTAEISGLPTPLKDFQVAEWSEDEWYMSILIHGKGLLRPLDPLFNYERKVVESALDVNLPSTHRFPDGSYNINDPAAVIYPKAVGRPPWSRLPASITEEQVRRFLRFEDPGFFVPLRQKVANGLSLFSIFAWVVAMVFLYWKKRAPDSV